MSKERQIPLQYDMFTGEPVDNRTEAQKKRDREREKPQQTEMFASREVAQFGVNSRPLIELSSHTKLTLISEDPRTEEEIEADRQRAAEELTHQMFARNPELYNREEAEAPATMDLALIPQPVVALVVYGYLEEILLPFDRAL